jgi:uridine phosphorylase
MSEDESISKPSEAIRYCAETRRVPVDALKIPQRLILTYLKSTFQCGKRLIHGENVEWIYGERVPLCIGRFNGVEVGIGQFWIGAPATVAILEEAIACCAKVIFEVGISGGIQPDLKPGDIVVVTEAIRDEGTSFHYLSQEVRVESHQSLRNRLIERLKANGIKYFAGPVWSTDGVYRETVRKIRKFRDSGVLAVDMETSAIFALAKYRHVEVASAQIISDVLTEDKWMLAFDSQMVRESEEILLKNVLEAVSEK